jgi:hypothetical protein
VCVVDKLAYVRLPFDLATLPDGWFSKHEVNVLYQLVSMMPTGRILEVGPWIGRSTVVICQALSRRPDRCEFHTVDFGIASEQEWDERYPEEPLSSKANADVYRPHINQAGGSLVSLDRNLRERGFDHLVQVHRGDFLEVAPPGPYQLIFCDATHSNEEIDRHVPTLLSMLAPGGILACDDIDANLEAYMRERFGWAWAHVDSLLFYGQPADGSGRT